MSPALVLLKWISETPYLHCRRLASLACLGPVVVAMVSITLVWTLNLHEKRGIKIVGAIQPGLPPVTMPWWGRMHSPLQIFKTAGVTVFVSILEAVSIAKALAEKHGYQINPEVELRGVPLLIVYCSSMALLLSSIPRLHGLGDCHEEGISNRILQLQGLSRLQVISRQ